MRDSTPPPLAYGSLPWREGIQQSTQCVLFGLAKLGRSFEEAKAETVKAARLAIKPGPIPAEMPSVAGLPLVAHFSILIDQAGLRDEAGGIDDMTAESIMDIVQKSLDDDPPYP